jgi:class 3 adenylate cyclase
MTISVFLADDNLIVREGVKALLDLESFNLGIGISTGPVAAALIGSEERVEYTVVGDIVDLTQRLQQWGEAGETVISDPTWDALSEKPDSDVLEPALVKGRETPVGAHRFPRKDT